MTNTVNLKSSNEDNTLLNSAILSHLLPEYKNTDLRVFEQIESTNEEAKRLIKENENKVFAVVSNMQTSGRGRLGRSFFSPNKTGIYLSIAFSLEDDVKNPLFITSAAALCVCLAIEKVARLYPQIKWVNDIFLNGKKVCGILTEAVNNPQNGKIKSVVIGIGINFNTKLQDFPCDIAKTAGSLFENTELTIDKNLLISQLINQTLSVKELIKTTAFLDEYRKRSFVIGKEIKYTENNSFIPATAIAIDNEGGLVVRNKSGEIKTLSSGEITVRLS